MTGAGANPGADKACWHKGLAFLCCRDPGAGVE